jgi:TonB family protein
MLALILTTALALPDLALAQVGTSTRAATHTPTITAAVGALVPTATSTRTQAQLTKDGIGRVMKANLVRFKRCYEVQLKTKPKLEGTIIPRFTIGDRGTVTDASIASTSMNDPEVEACVLSVVRELQFPPTQRGRTMVISYPLKFGSEPSKSSKRPKAARASKDVE